MSSTIQSFAKACDDGEHPFTLRMSDVPPGFCVVWGDGEHAHVVTRTECEREWSPDGALWFIDRGGMIPVDSWGQPPVVQAREDAAARIELVRDAAATLEWRVKLDVPHCTFAIRKDGDVVSRGAVFLLADCVRAPAPQPERQQ